jgi:hypothetical protein
MSNTISNSIVIKGTKEFIKNSSDTVNNNILKTSEILPDTSNLNYIIFFLIIIGIIIIILYNNGITFNYIINKFVDDTSSTLKQTIMTTVTGAKSSLNFTEKTFDKAVNIVDETIGIEKPDDFNLNLKSKNINTNLLKKQIKHIPKPDISMNNIKKKSGYCYIGEDRGFRSCIKVSQHDTCMSEQIFPTRDICINPNLRQ